jgi:hypothetical protein
MTITTRLTRTAAAAAAALSLAAAPAPALAWGKNEQNFLKGVLTAVAIGAIVQHSRKAQAAPTYFAPAPAPKPHYGGTYGYSPVAAAFAEYSPASKRAIQSRLRAYGYYRGSVDGVFGPGTRAAIEAYARDTGNSGALGSRDGTVRLLNGLLV